MKLKLGLIPGFFLKALALPLMLGEAKYARGDWANQDNPQQFIYDRSDSLFRHIADFQDGIHYDEDGQHNLAAAAWNALVILYYLHKHAGVQLVNPNFAVKLDEYRAKKAAKAEKEVIDESPTNDAAA